MSPLIFTAYLVEMKHNPVLHCQTLVFVRTERKYGSFARLFEPEVAETETR